MRCRRPLIPTSLVPAAAVSLLIAGCGGGSPRSTATATTTHTGALALADCMRSHGVPNFPDPNSSGVISKAEVIPLLGTPQFEPARRACAHLSSGLGRQEPAVPTPTRLADALAFARCMRAHGFPSFPDPTSQGQLTPQMVTAAGIDLHQPDLLRAGLACVPVTHGLLTWASIERAVNGG